MSKSEWGSLSFKIKFLRAMAPQLTGLDLEAFRVACDHIWRADSVTKEDLETIERLFVKFDRPEEDSASQIPKV